MTAVPVPVLAATSGLVVRPGDTLIVATSIMFFDEERDEYRDRLRELLPPEVGFVVLEGCSGVAVYRPDPEMEPAPPDWFGARK